MKKKILVVNKSFELGGIQSSLNSLLNVIQKEYDIDLLIFNNKGPLKNYLPENIKLIEPSVFVKTLGMSYKDCKDNKNKNQIGFKIFSALWAKVFGNYIPVLLALVSQKKLKGYDIAIAYHQEQKRTATVNGFVRFILKCTDAKTKIAWVHNDFLETKLNTKFNYKIYKNIDKVVCVSKSTMNSFIKSFPGLEGKCNYFYNYIDSEYILKNSYNKENLYKNIENETIFFTACRLAKEKGIKRTLSAMIFLWNEGYKFKWYIAGEGKEYNDLKKYIKEKNISKKAILLGYRNDPYDYIRQCDCYLMTSFHETFSMTVAEAKVLNKLILATNIPVMKELLDKEVDILCENNLLGIREGIKKVLFLKNKVKNISKKNLNISKKYYLEQFKELIEKRS